MLHSRNRGYLQAVHIILYFLIASFGSIIDFGRTPCSISSLLD